MTADLLSIREASELLGVSQLRVRELIRKGKIDAQKVLENGSERWSIMASSAQGYLQARPAAAPANGHVLAALEQQLGRVRALIDELNRMQSYIDGLRKAQGSLEAEIKQLRTQAQAPAAEPQPQPEPEPEAEPPKPTKRTSKNGTAIAKALDDAEAAKPAAKKRTKAK